MLRMAGTCPIGYAGGGPWTRDIGPMQAQPGAADGRPGVALGSRVRLITILDFDVPGRISIDHGIPPRDRLCRPDPPARPILGPGLTPGPAWHPQPPRRRSGYGSAGIACDETERGGIKPSTVTTCDTNALRPAESPFLYARSADQRRESARRACQWVVEDALEDIGEFLGAHPLGRVFVQQPGYCRSQLALVGRAGWIVAQDRDQGGLYIITPERRVTLERTKQCHPQ